MFDTSNYSAKSKSCDNSNELVEGKTKYEMGGVTVSKFVGLKPRMYLILVSNCNEYKK